MADLLSTLYPWIKAFHVMAVLSWMAGLFYLPRLYVYHAERGLGGGEPGASLAIMEDKLFRLITVPAAWAAWGAGLALVLTPGVVDWGLAWPWAKAAGVIALTGFHLWLGRQRGALARGTGLTGRQYRLLNEVPTLLMVVIVVAVIVKF